MRVVISGASSGIGRATAVLFAREGHEVFDLSRSGRSEANLQHIPCDLQKAEDITAAAQMILGKAGGAGESGITKTVQNGAGAAGGAIDLLICNAGFGISGSFEETSEEAYARQFDVNVYGAIRLIQAFLPSMRAQGKGRILIVSSVAGEIAIPFQSFYAASKACLNSLALALANELRTFGISVSVLMPGDTATPFTGHRQKASSSIYHDLLESSVARMEKDERSGVRPDKVAAKLYQLGLQDSAPPPLVTLGFSYRCLVFLYRLLPRRFGNWLVGKIYAKK